jgi:aminoacrylate hydrolase
MPFVAIADTDVYYEILGNGPPVVLISGLAGVASYWEPNIEDLARQFTVIRYDHRGTGRTSRPEQAYSIELLADDLIGLMDALGIARAVLVGHSTGGAIGQVVAARHPDRVDRLVLYGSWASLCPQMRLCMEVRRKVLKAEGAAGFHRSSPIFLYPPRYICEAWPVLERELEVNVATSPSPAIIDARIEAVVRFDGVPYLPAITAPTMVLVAEDDILTPPLAAAELAGAIVGARFETLAYGAHAVSYCEPAAFNRAVTAFLNG